MALRAAISKGSGRRAFVCMASSKNSKGVVSATRQASRPSVAEECRTIVRDARFGVLSTVSRSDPKGYPVGSVVAFSCDDRGRPLMFLSTLSKHTQDLSEDERASLTVAVGLASAEDARVVLVGPVRRLESDIETQQAKEAFSKCHPESFWIDFGDFHPYRMERVLQARFVGGFARAGTAGEEEYARSLPDPVSMFFAPISKHMNEDHEQQIILCIKHFCELEVDSARIVGLDRLGLDVQVESEGTTYRVRLPFLGPAEDRKQVKDRIVELTRTAMAGVESGAADP